MRKPLPADIDVMHATRDELATLERALAAEGIPMGGSYPALNDLEVFRRQRFGPRLRAGAPSVDYANLHLPVAEALR